MKALILIDIQNDFMPGGSLPVKDGDHIIKPANEIQPLFDLVVATQDWHPKNHKSFASNHTGKKTYEKIRLHGHEQVLWPDHCVQETKGADFHSSLNMSRVEAIFRKGMNPEIDSYSGFYDNGYKKTTGLAGYLHERNVTRVFLCGLAGDYCVAFTAKDAMKEDFDTYVIEDITRPIDANGYHKVKEKLVKGGCHFLSRNDVGELLE